jgi:hypothetical protein
MARWVPPRLPPPVWLRAAARVRVRRRQPPTTLAAGLAVASVLPASGSLQPLQSLVALRLVGLPPPVLPIPTLALLARPLPAPPPPWICVPVLAPRGQFYVMIQVVQVARALFLIVSPTLESALVLLTLPQWQVHRCQQLRPC